MNTSEQPLLAYYNYGGQQINARRVDAVNFYTEREKVQANAFTQEDIDRLRQEYVPTTALGSAVEALGARNAVALIGPSGCGRRITGGAAIIELGAMPHYPIYLDPGDDRRDLPADHGCGYLVDIDEEAVREIEGLKDLIAGYRGRLAQAGAYLVILATPGAWGMLGQQTELATVTMRLPEPVDVFRSHLRYVRPADAEDASARPEVIKVLTGTSPADAVRLAVLVSAALSARSREDPVQEAIAAYHNWSEELTVWFRAHEEGYHRALLIAAATLNGVNAAAVFDAADRLSERVGLPHPPGGGLVGDGVAKLVEEIGADITDDGRIRLPRPAYPVSVLDHVWRDRPHLRADLKNWLVGLPGSLDAAQAPAVGAALVDLAVRQGDATLITNALGTWAKLGKVNRELAATTLTGAAVSNSIGRAVRRTMYRWATSAGTDPSLQLTITEVCGGQFGRRFPSNALTRLRHLARNGGPAVRDQVAASLRTLAMEPGLLDFMLREIVAWAASDDQASAPSVSAFLGLAIERAADLVPRTPSDNSRIELLAEGLRAALRDPDHVIQAREACCSWLEAAAAQGQLPVEVVIDIIARTCRDSYDIGLLAPVVWQWGHASDRQPTLIPRDEIATVLLQKAANRDPLAPGVSAATMYQVTSEANQ